MRTAGRRIGVLTLCSFRPFPLDEVRAALEHAKRVVVLEKSLAVGLGGMVSDGVRKALSGIVLSGHTVIAGLGGRAVTRTSLRTLFERAERGELLRLEFLDLNRAIVEREIARLAQRRRAGPTAEAILRGLGHVASQIG
jgi:pyruvate ferredoxin oxidoreductase alpha subunit